MRRGELWTVSGGADHTGKPRPAVVVQHEAFSLEFSITVCPLTGDPGEFPLFRIPVSPTPENGLEVTSRIMADKLSTIPRSKVGKRIGVLTNEQMALIDRALIVFLGLGG